MNRIPIFFVALVLTVSCGRYLDEAIESPVIEGRRVTFRLKSPSARRVQIAGDWPENNWAKGDGEAGEVLVGLMERNEETGVWEITRLLEPGRYRYIFLVDETYWVLDPNNVRVVDDGRGGKANLLILP
jgi:enterochelin esterase family protein